MPPGLRDPPCAPSVSRRQDQASKTKTKAKAKTETRTKTRMEKVSKLARALMPGQRTGGEFLFSSLSSSVISRPNPPRDLYLMLLILCQIDPEFLEFIPNFFLLTSLDCRNSHCWGEEIGLVKRVVCFLSVHPPVASWRGQRQKES